MYILKINLKEILCLRQGQSQGELPLVQLRACGPGKLRLQSPPPQHTHIGPTFFTPPKALHRSGPNRRREHSRAGSQRSVRPWAADSEPKATQTPPVAKRLKPALAAYKRSKSRERRSANQTRRMALPGPQPSLTAEPRSQARPRMPALSDASLLD